MQPACCGLEDHSCWDTMNLCKTDLLTSCSSPIAQLSERLKCWTPVGIWWSAWWHHPFHLQWREDISYSSCASSCGFPWPGVYVESTCLCGWGSLCGLKDCYPCRGGGRGGTKPTCRIPFLLLGNPGIVIQPLEWNCKVTFLNKPWALVWKYLRLAPPELSASMITAAQFFGGMPSLHMCCFSLTCA